MPAQSSSVLPRRSRHEACFQPTMMQLAHAWPLLAVLVSCGLVGGFAAGLLGVGGGIVTVPVLEYALRFTDIPSEYRMHVAVATSLAAIIPTSITSARMHHARGAVDWELVRRWGAPMLVAAFIGSLLAALGALYFFFRWKGAFPLWFLRVIVLCVPLGFIAVEAGWVVTEVGGQPWIIYGFLKTKDALTPVPGMRYHFFLFLGLYILLGFVTAWLLKRQVMAAQQNAGQLEAAHRSFHD